MSLKFKIYSYFMNKKAVHTVLDSHENSKLKAEISLLPKNLGHHENLHLDEIYLRAVISLIQRKEIPQLLGLLLENKPIEGELFTLDYDYYFRDIKKSERENACVIHNSLREFGCIRIQGVMGKEHFTCNSASSELSGHNNLFLFGYVEGINNNVIHVKPIILGKKVLVNDDEVDSIIQFNSLEIRPEKIREFTKIEDVSFDKLNADKVIKLMGTIPEAKIKENFAKLLSENDVQKDWGGETSDLFTSHIHVNNERLSAAFLFKGPSKHHPMKIADLGKNGDQIVRLFEEPADLFIIQHCHYITSQVKRNMEAFASRYFRIKKYMIIDGIDTFRIFKAYDLL